jgi:class 3 adenylate cyclase/tetratricopeptide (TPR) repeat protein
VPAAFNPGHLAEKIIAGARAHAGERKQVTVLFADVKGSMDLIEDIDPERWHEVMDQFFTLLCAGVHRYEGTVSKFTGDGIMALFGAPIAHEDHAVRACHAAHYLTRELAAYGQELSREGLEFAVRIGLNSGEVILGSVGKDLAVDYTVLGQSVGLAQRMESLARPGSACLTEHTAKLASGFFVLEDLGPTEVKGVRDRMRIYRLVEPGGAHSRVDAAPVGGLSPFVGRASERDRLDAALASALAGNGRIVGIVGEPGIGKTRFCREFASACDKRGLTVTKGSAMAHGRATPLLPVLAMLRDFFGLDDHTPPAAARERIEAASLELDPALGADLALLFEFLGIADRDRPPERIDPEARQRRLLQFVGRLVDARSRREPGVILIEDLHWLDDASAVFLDELVAAATRTPTLLVATFRPGYDAVWMRGSGYEQLALSALDEDSAAELLRRLLGDDPSTAEVAELIRARTAGNPFFMEEMVRALAETGHLVGARGAYRVGVPVADLVLPATVQAVLSARIDRLSPRDKALVQTMSVIGKEVPEGVLRELADLSDDDLDRAVEALVAAEFVSEIAGDEATALAFKHPLTQEVAYASQLSADRARAHARVAAAIETVYADALDERAALLAHHIEAAGRPLDAAQWHARAAAWVALASPSDGISHWRRVRELTDALPPSPEVTGLAVLARIWILALSWRVGMSHDEAAGVHAEGVAMTEGPDQAVPRVLLDLGYATKLVTGARERDGHAMTLAASRRTLELGEPGLALSVCGAAGFGLWIMGPVTDGIELMDLALGLAGDAIDAGSGLVFGCPYAVCLFARGLCGAYAGGLAQAHRDFERAIELARQYGDPETESYALGSRATVHAEIYATQSAVGDAERAVELAERSGNGNALVCAWTGLAFVAARARHFERALLFADRALAVARERDLAQMFAPVLLETLARSRLGLGDIDGALEAGNAAVAVAEERCLDRICIGTRVTQAEVLLAANGAGSIDAVAAALGRALELIGTTGALLHEPATRFQLAALERLRGAEQAAAEAEAAARRILTEVGAPPDAFVHVGRAVV